MYIIKPQKFNWSWTDSANIPLETYSVALPANKGYFNPTTPYATGEMVKIEVTAGLKDESENNYIAWFEARDILEAGLSPLTNPLSWKRIASDNKTAWLDKYLGTQTIHTQTIKQTISIPTDADTIIFLACDASSIKVGDTTKDFLATFDGYTYSSTCYFYVTGGVDLQIEIAKLFGDSKPKIGKIVVGKRKLIGDSMVDSFDASMIDFSIITTDDTGNDSFKKQGVVKVNSFGIQIESDNKNEAYRYMSDIRATPCVFIGTGEDEIGTNYGVYKDFKLSPLNDLFYICSFTVRGTL